MKIVWRMSPGDDSMRTMANDVKQHIDEKRKSRRGLNITIVDKGRGKSAQR